MMAQLNEIQAGQNLVFGFVIAILGQAPEIVQAGAYWPSRYSVVQTVILAVLALAVKIAGEGLWKRWKGRGKDH